MIAVEMRIRMENGTTGTFRRLVAVALEFAGYRQLQREGYVFSSLENRLVLRRSRTRRRPERYGQD